MEIIKHSGRLQVAMDAAGLSKKQVDLFGRTANHPEAAGPDARHARSKQEPPKQPMPIAHARKLISTLVRAWLDANANTDRATSAKERSN
jgi:hypothetical protein